MTLSEFKSHLNNTGTITEDQRNELIKEIIPFIQQWDKELREKYNVGYGTWFLELIKCMLEPYVLFNKKMNESEREQKRAFQSLRLRKGFEIHECFHFLRLPVDSAFRRHGKEAAIIMVSYYERTFQEFYTISRLYTERGDFYTGNIFKKKIEEWIEKLKIMYFPERYNLQKELECSNNTDHVNGKGDTEKGDTMDTIIYDKAAKERCFQVFEALQLIVNSNPVKLGPRQAGKLGGVLDALNETPNIFKGIQSLPKLKLLAVFNVFFGTEFKEYKTSGKEYRNSYHEAKRILQR